MSPKFKKRFLLLALVGSTILVLSILFSFFTKPATPPISVQPTQKLNPREQLYPEATPQEFFSSDSADVGTLIVDSNPQGARVVIDTTEEEVPDANNPQPVNITPFKITTIPTGAHTLTASKQGYNFVVVDFTIEKGSVTRLMLNLAPQEKSVGF